MRGVREIVRNIPLSPDEELVCDRIAGVTRREGGEFRPLETPCLWKGKEYARRMAFRMGRTASGRRSGRMPGVARTLSPRHF